MVEGSGVGRGSSAAVGRAEAAGRVVVRAAWERVPVAASGCRLVPNKRRANGPAADLLAFGAVDASSAGRVAWGNAFF